MGWQDRDYAREDYGQPYRRVPTGGLSGWLWGGSMVHKLLIANVVMYLLCYYTALGPALRGQVLERTVFNQPVGFAYQPGWLEMITSKVLEGQVWRLVTSQYLHDGQITHILFNMLGLYLLGRELERRWGSKKFLAVYTAAGVCGNLLLMAAALAGWIGMHTPALGASGSVLGLLGAAAVLIPDAEVFIYFMFIRIRTAAILFGVMYLYNIQMRGRNYGGDICHLAGMLFGAWWAWRGDRRWSRRRFAWPSIRLPSFRLPRFRTARPEPWDTKARDRGAWDKKVPDRAARQQEVDRILAKVYDGGIGSLTPEERQTLREATEASQRGRS